MDTLLFAFGLGLAGFDVFGVILVLLLLANKVSRREIVLFATTVFISMVTAGTIATLLLGDSTELIAQTLKQLPSVVWVVVEIVAGALLVGWAIARIYAQPPPERKPEDSRIIKWLKRSIILGGVLYALSSFTDPSLLALIAFTSRGHSLPIIIMTQIIWLLVSQGLFFILTLAVARNTHAPLITWFERTRQRHGVALRHIITGIIIVCGVMLCADTVTFIVSGNWLLPE